MNGITINNKQYIFLETSREVDYDKCDLDEDDLCNNSMDANLSTTCYMVLRDAECLRN